MACVTEKLVTTEVDSLLRDRAHDGAADLEHGSMELVLGSLDLVVSIGKQR